MTSKKNLTLLAVSLVVANLIAELALRLLTSFPIHGRLAHRIPDEALEYRMKPGWRDTDAAGFRNPSTLQSAYLVALGDSHTYGFNVESESSWPYQLSEMIDRSVYNFGVGSYGVLNYYHLMDEALALDPAVIVLGLYLPNDLTDMCARSRLKFWRQLARQDPLLQQLEDVCSVLRQQTANPRTVTRTTQLFSMMRTKTALASAIAYFFQNHAPKGGMTRLEEPGYGTAFGHQRVLKHLRNMDTAVPEIAALAKIAIRCLQRMGDAANERGVDFLVMLIPSKENVFYDLLESKDVQRPESLTLSVQRERSLTATFVDSLAQSDIDSVDPRRRLTESLATAPGLYPNSVNNHPLKAGYRVYAEAALAGIRTTQQ